MISNVIRAKIEGIPEGFKRCSKCKEVRQTTNFGKLKKSKDGFRYECIQCRSDYYKSNEEGIREKGKKYYEDNREKVLESTKRYKEDHQEWYRTYNKKYYTDNKDCIQQRVNNYHIKNRESILPKLKIYRINNKNKINELKKKFYIKNKEKINKEARKYYANNKERITESRKIYYENNKEKFIEGRKKYRLRNPGSSTIYKQVRKAREKKLKHTLKSVQWEKIKKDFDYKCSYCGKAAVLEQEHFLALSKGGEYAVSNIIPACKPCNSSKGNKKFRDWYPSQKFYSKKREVTLLSYLGYKNSIQQLTFI